MPRLLIHAGGYKLTPWKTDHQEIATVLHKRCGGTPDIHWAPTTRDFAAAGTTSGGSTAAATLDELLKVIRSKDPESIEELRIIGHANKDGLYLSGEVRPDDVYFTQEDSGLAETPTFRKALPKFRELQDRFARDAQVVLLACNSGTGGDLLKLMSEAFLRPAAGFKSEIHYKFDWGPIGATLKEKDGTPVCTGQAKNAHVTRRGLMMYSPQADELADVLNLGVASNAALYQGDAWRLKPDQFANDGDLLRVLRDNNTGRAAVALMWLVMKFYFPEHPWVAGSGEDPALSGLRVRVSGDRVMIDVGPDFARKTTSPKALNNRVAELKQALDLVGQKKAGVVPCT
jgi:hypothetical protein